MACLPPLPVVHGPATFIATRPVGLWKQGEAERLALGLRVWSVNGLDGSIGSEHDLSRIVLDQLRARPLDGHGVSYSSCRTIGRGLLHCPARDRVPFAEIAAR